MIEEKIEAAKKRCLEANGRFQRIKTVHDQAKAKQESAVTALQCAQDDLAEVRAGVLLGDTPQKELAALRKKIVQLRQDVDELPGAVSILADEMEKARKESSKAQQELDLLKVRRDYPIVLAEFVQAGKDDVRALGRLNVLAVQIGKGEEVRRLATEIRAHTTGSRFKEPFVFTPDP